MLERLERTEDESRSRRRRSSIVTAVALCVCVCESSLHGVFPDWEKRVAIVENRSVRRVERGDLKSAAEAIFA